jgi:hypothetical protein
MRDLDGRGIIRGGPSLLAHGFQLSSGPVLTEAADRELLSQFILQPTGQDDRELLVGDNRSEVLGRSNAGTRRSYDYVSDRP